MKCPFITKPVDNGVYVEDCLGEKCGLWINRDNLCAFCSIGFLLQELPLIRYALEKIADNMPP